MAKKKETLNYNLAELQPDEINSLRALVKEFIDKMSNIDNEISLLGEDKKQLIEDYSDKLDVKTLKAAMSVVRIQNGVQHRDTFDLFLEALTDPVK